MSTSEKWPAGVAAITLFVEDLPGAKSFYTKVFELTVMFEDENSAAFRFGDTVINLVRVQAAAGPRLAGLGVELLNGPMDRPWGPRTASFRAPGGQIWEFAH